MKGDFTRNTFDPLHRFSRVLMQQGRVQLDADWNEQADISLHLLRSLAADLIGPHGGVGTAFQIGQRAGDDGRPMPSDFTIGAGNYYVGGVLCESTGQNYTAQSGYKVDPGMPEILKGDLLVYLDVWERHVSHLEAEGMRETALGGPDTASRARVEWQVKVIAADFNNEPPPFKEEYASFLNHLSSAQIYRENKPLLMADVPQTSAATDACVIPADSRYRGIENQLYRVEVHKSGTTWDGTAAGKAGAATFKWSRENGSVVFAVSDVHVNSASNVTTVTLDSLGRDRKLGLSREDLVELVDDAYALRNDADPLLRVIDIDEESMTVTLEGQALNGVGSGSHLHPMLRRWDHRLDAAGAKEALDGALMVQANATNAGHWLKLEDGIQVRFRAGDIYLTGDYWLIPARTGTGDIEWPLEADPVTRTMGPAWAAPQGVAHRYAPLSLLRFSNDGIMNPDGVVDLRRVLIQLWA
ncbi:DUF6519 domain-containing protein [Massilia sp. CF038]|uniref:DUF6519 domain-containing protein n=1 Tax=Massilia sp. CF038 TaxID=1881045 RepID=UPI00091B667F|nr:DUF6519 domain-containing protein [Massilia sp. CF038]SHG51806.1 hypothetical protein SAMN05428948_0829 [Massilia sp. CF038]